MRVLSPCEPVAENNTPALVVVHPAMTQLNGITCLFLDIGGVVLSDGWCHEFRSRAAMVFNLDRQELEDRHHQNWAALELGQSSLDEYLEIVVFHRSRPFTRAQFIAFIYAQSQADQQMLDLIRSLKRAYGLKVIVVSNEGRELNDFRIRTFNLTELVDIFISSCFVHLRKPDAAIFRLALDVSQVPVDNIIYIENTEKFVIVAEGLGIRSILHTDYQSTADKLASFGLQIQESSHVVG